MVTNTVRQLLTLCQVISYRHVKFSLYRRHRVNSELYFEDACEMCSLSASFHIIGEPSIWHLWCVASEMECADGWTHTNLPIMFLVSLAFASPRTESVTIVMSVRLPVCLPFHPHISAGLPLDRSQRSLIMETFTKICLENPNLVKIGQNYRALYVHFIFAGDIKSL
jgi:hypothetical protein